MLTLSLVDLHTIDSFCFHFPVQERRVLDPLPLHVLPVFVSLSCHLLQTRPLARFRVSFTVGLT